MALLAAWDFNEASGNALDSSGNGNTITAFGSGLTRVTGYTGSGMTGTAGSSVTLLSPTVGQTADRTLMFWAKLDGVTGYIQMEDTGGNARWGIDKGQGFVRTRAVDSGGATLAEIAALATGTFRHYAGTYTSGTVKLYVDGALAASNTMTGPILTDSARIVVGQFSTGSTLHVFDDLRIYDSALTQSEIATAAGLLAPGRPQSYVPRRRAANW